MNIGAILTTETAKVLASMFGTVDVTDKTYALMSIPTHIFPVNAGKSVAAYGIPYVQNANTQSAENVVALVWDSIDAYRENETPSVYDIVELATKHLNARPLGQAVTPAGGWINRSGKDALFVRPTNIPARVEFIAVKQTYEPYRVDFYHQYCDVSNVCDGSREHVFKEALTSNGYDSYEEFALIRGGNDGDEGWAFKLDETVDAENSPAMPSRLDISAEIAVVMLNRFGASLAMPDSGEVKKNISATEAIQLVNEALGKTVITMPYGAGDECLFLKLNEKQREELVNEYNELRASLDNAESMYSAACTRYELWFIRNVELADWPEVNELVDE